MDDATLDISGNADIDGTTNLDAVDIDGAVQIDATFTSGVDGQGYDTKFFGDTSSAYMLWDTSADDLIFAGGAGLIVPDGQFTLGSTAVSSTAAEINLLDAVTRGSILYGNSSGATARLAKGNANEVLTSDGTDIAWAAASGALAGIDDQTSSNDDQLTITDTAIIINEDSDDLDFRVESNGNANMFTVNGGSDLVGVGSDPDLGVGLHIKSADSGASVAGGADELVVEGSGHAGITVASGASSGASLLFANSSGTGRGGLAYYEADNNTYFYSGGDNVANLSDNGSFFLTDDGERTNGGMTTGLTINQAATDDDVFALKSSDVAHGRTSYAETDTYFRIRKSNAANGGVQMTVLSEGDGAGENQLSIHVNGQPTLTTTKGSANWNAAMEHVFFGHDNANSLSDVNANGNIFSIATSKGSGTPYIFGIDEDGDIYQDGSTNNAFDAWDDAALLRSMQLQQSEDHTGRNSLALKDQIVKSRFDSNRYTKEHLEQARLIEVQSDEKWNAGERSLYNETARGYLQTGAIWQNHEMIDALMEAIDAAMTDAGVNNFQTDYVKPRFVARGLPTQILDWNESVPDDIVVPDIAPKAFNS